MYHTKTIRGSYHRNKLCLKKGSKRGFLAILKTDILDIKLKFHPGWLAGPSKYKIYMRKKSYKDVSLKQGGEEKKSNLRKTRKLDDNIPI